MVGASCRSFRLTFAISAALLANANAKAANANADCADLIADAGPVASATRAPTAADLIELREIGNLGTSTFSGPSPLAVSPDGTSVAYVLAQPRLASNGSCRALVVSSTRVPGPPRVLDRGGMPILIDAPARGYYIPSGFPDVVTPIWSPDGARIAYRRRDGGVTRAWVVAVESGDARPVSAQGHDVVAAAWSADGERLVYAVRSGMAAQAQAIEREGARGWLYDERIIPDISPRPALAANDALDVFAVDLRSGRAAAAGSGDRASLKVPGLPGYPIDVAATATDGRRAWLERREPSPLAPTSLIANDRQGRRIACAHDSCVGGILSLWWREDTILYLRREGWNKEELALYRWSVGTSAPAAILRTSDVLRGCVEAASALVCTHETSTRPRRLVSVDTRTGGLTALFDPNPAFGNLQLGTVRRLRWRNALGLESWGDLVLPRNHRAGERLPLVVVQYQSVGFLRGGTGDEYPIYLFPQRGLAVLSIERPPFAASADKGLADWNAVHAANQRDWAERRSLLSAVLAGVSAAVATGTVDPQRVGISGLSDGSATVAFALINSDAFAAAAMSTCCMEPLTTMAIGGIGWADQLRSMGYPPFTADNRAFWRPMSLAQNAARIDVPLLMQLSDNEFRLALEAYAALREQRKPVEMFVYPDEFHTKVQPAHRRAVYERNLDWFSFWLRNERDPDPAKAAQYARWELLRPAHKVPLGD